MLCIATAAASAGTVLYLIFKSNHSETAHIHSLRDEVQYGSVVFLNDPLIYILYAT